MSMDMLLNNNSHIIKYTDYIKEKYPEEIKHLQTLSQHEINLGKYNWLRWTLMKFMIFIKK